jgi:hypothetical protein
MRAAEPMRPAEPVRPAGAGGPADAMRPGTPDMFVYRDSDDDHQDYPEPDAEAAAEREAAYWYGSTAAVTAEPEPAEPLRGPFEPLRHSDGDDADAVTAAEPGAAASQSSGPVDDDADEPAEQRARKLEQIKDFYLTAEAIGEENVDKHFDQLLAQQRELIGEYFKQSAARKDESGHAGAEPTEAGAPGSGV